MTESNYHTLSNSTIFNENLKRLNASLKTKLEENNYLPVLIGNLFYDHEQMNPPFYDSSLLKDCEEKRIRLYQAAQGKRTMFEIGLNGGHSAFLSLMSNKELMVYSNDIAEFYKPCPNIHPEIYVHAGANTLTEMFPNRFQFIRGSCLTEVPKFVKNNPNVLLDLVHIDGDKSTYKQDFMNIKPLLQDNALIVFDDTQNPSVQSVVDNLIKDKHLHRVSEFPKMNSNVKYRNEILVYRKTI